MEVDGILSVLDGDDIAFRPIEGHLPGISFAGYEFKNLNMAMGSADADDVLELTFKVEGEFIEMSFQLLDQSKFVPVAYALLSMCSSAV